MKITFITGHTASGKTDYIFDLVNKYTAKNTTTVVINSDAYQIYKDLSIISAQPEFVKFTEKGRQSNEISTPQQIIEISKIFRLYGNFSSFENISVFKMINLIKAEVINAVQQENVENIIITGGSPMYMRLLVDGLKNKANEETEADKTEDFGAFCINKFKNYKEIKIEKLILYKNRQTLYNNASLRFDSMIQKGAIGEVANYLNKIKEFILNSDEINTIEALTSYKTLGVREIEKYLTGLINFEEMSSLIKQKTRNYIKHQDTWFRNKFKDFTLI